MGGDPAPYQAMGSLEFAKKVLADAKVAISPGIGFGDYGDNHVRFALIENEHRIRQAVRGIKEMLRKDGKVPLPQRCDQCCETHPRRVAGLGTVGRGTYEVLQRNQQEIARRAGRGIESRGGRGARRRQGTRRCRLQSAGLVELQRGDCNPDIDIVVELIGGYEPAYALALEAIGRGKHVVTANKALLARHGNELFEAARTRRRDVGLRGRSSGRHSDHQGAA